MGYEIDYIPVGEGDSSGDAICMRYGNLHGTRAEQRVVVIDGGYKDSGKKLVEHIKNYYGTDYVDLVIATHPDNDHISGLHIILEELDVNQLAMHKPWDHGDEIKNLFVDGRITASGLEDRLEKSLQQASDLEKLATQKGIPIVEPFQGITGFEGTIHILGPSQEYYEMQLAHFRPTPEPIPALSFLKPVVTTAEKIVNWIEDRLDLDLLDNDDDGTSAENNSSVIVLFDIDGQKILFTGDSGKTGQLEAIKYSHANGILLSDLNFLDVPHHGSKHNISSNILKFIKAKTAFVSATKDSSKHPSRRVTNALHKHGARVFVNRDATLRHNKDAPNRVGWSPAEKEPFHNRVRD